MLSPQVLKKAWSTSGYRRRKKPENRWCFHNAIKNIVSFPQNLSTAIEHVEKLLSKANFTILISCYRDRWADLKHIQITRTVWVVRISWESQACSTTIRGELIATFQYLENRLPRTWSQNLYWTAQQDKEGKSS